MDFCKNCGKVLFIEIENEKKIGRCSCGYMQETDITSSEKIKEKAKKGEGTIEHKNDIKEGFPHICKKCDHKEADVHEIKTGYSDEADIYLFKCKKCGHAERQADGCSNK